MTWAWVAVLTAGALLEVRALLTKEPGDTLSEHVWRWFDVRGKGGKAQAKRAALLLGMTWLTAHFITGGLV